MDEQVFFPCFYFFYEWVVTINAQELDKNSEHISKNTIYVRCRYLRSDESSIFLSCHKFCVLW